MKCRTSFLAGVLSVPGFGLAAHALTMLAGRLSSRRPR